MADLDPTDDLYREDARTPAPPPAVVEDIKSEDMEPVKQVELEPVTLAASPVPSLTPVGEVERFEPVTPANVDISASREQTYADNFEPAAPMPEGEEEELKDIKEDEQLIETSESAEKEESAEEQQIAEPVSAEQRTDSVNNDANDVEDDLQGQPTAATQLPVTSDLPATSGEEDPAPPPQPAPLSSDGGWQEAEVDNRRYSVVKLPRPGKMSAKDGDGTVIGAEENEDSSGCCAIILTIMSYILVVLFFPFSLCATIKVVQEYERAVIFRLGRLVPGGAKGPGIFFVMPCIEEYTKVDLRTVSFDVPPQEVLTRDSVTVSVDAVVYYRISNPTVSVANVENAANSTQLLAQTTLRNVLGTQDLAQILSNREHISEQMQNVLDDATDKWGIKVERVEIKDVRLPTQLQRAMAAEAEAARDARAKVIAAEGEQKASIALKEAADIINESPAALQLRYLQTLNSISAEKNSTIIFPLPIDLVAGFLKK